MVRITDDEPKQVKFTRKDKTALTLIGVLIAESPGKIRKFLSKYGIKTSDQPTSEELTTKVIHALSKNSRKFNNELSTLIEKQIVPADNYDFFDFSSIHVKDDLYDNYVAAIAGAVGGLAQAFSGIGKGKRAKEQARTESMKTIMAWKAQQERTQATAAKGKRQLMMVKVTGGLALLGLISWLVISQMNKQKLKTVNAKSQ